MPGLLDKDDIEMKYFVFKEFTAYFWLVSIPYLLSSCKYTFEEELKEF